MAELGGRRLSYLLPLLQLVLALSEECNGLRYRAVNGSECPCTGDEDPACDLPECSRALAFQSVGALCEADRALPDGQTDFDVDNCPGRYDIFVLECPAESCSVTNGSAESDTYPCTCGYATCTESWQRCDAGGGNGKCEAAPCSVSNGSGTSDTYPCTCGSSTCTQSWQRCYEDVDICAAGYVDFQVTSTLYTCEEGTEVANAHECEEALLTLNESYASNPHNPVAIGRLEFFGNVSSSLYPPGCSIECRFPVASSACYGRFNNYSGLSSSTQVGDNSIVCRRPDCTGDRDTFGTEPTNGLASPFGHCTTFSYLAPGSRFFACDSYQEGGHSAAQVCVECGRCNGIATPAPTAQPTTPPTAAPTPAPTAPSVLTTTTQALAAGAQELFVASSAGFKAGDTIVIRNAEAEQEEQHQVVGFGTGGSIRVAEGLERSYPVGSLVFILSSTTMAAATDDGVASVIPWIIGISASVVCVLGTVALLGLRRLRQQIREQQYDLEQGHATPSSARRKLPPSTWRQVGFVPSDLSKEDKDVLGQLGLECERFDGISEPEGFKGCIFMGDNCCLTDEDVEGLQSDPAEWCGSVRRRLASQEGELKTVDYVRSFWFVPREVILGMREDSPVPRHQELRDRGMLVQHEVSWDDVISGRFAEDHAASSHRWFTPTHPDPSCVKLKKLKEVLISNPRLKFVWLDYMCAPQYHGGGRTLAEVAEFHVTLDAILPYIFLGSTVLIFYENQYTGRFWPSVESWMSTKTATPDGLVPASSKTLPHGLKRMIVLGVQSSDGEEDVSTQTIVKRWHRLNASAAIEKLKKGDIAVTNQSDKIRNLEVLAKLDKDIQEYFVTHGHMIGRVRDISGGVGLVLSERVVASAECARSKDTSSQKGYAWSHPIRDVRPSSESPPVESEPDVSQPRRAPSTHIITV